MGRCVAGQSAGMQQGFGRMSLLSRNLRPGADGRQRARQTQETRFQHLNVPDRHDSRRPRAEMGLRPSQEAGGVRRGRRYGCRFPLSCPSRLCFNIAAQSALHPQPSGEGMTRQPSVALQTRMPRFRQLWGRSRVEKEPRERRVGERGRGTTGVRGQHWSNPPWAFLLSLSSPEGSTADRDAPLLVDS